MHPGLRLPAHRLCPAGGNHHGITSLAGEQLRDLIGYECPEPSPRLLERGWRQEQPRAQRELQPRAHQLLVHTAARSLQLERAGQAWGD